MTEEEMKKLVCPIFHIAQQINAIIQMQSSCFTKPADDKCSGSKCPMWRRKSEPTAWEKVSQNPDYYIPIEWGHGGYCGFGGKE